MTSMSFAEPPDLAGEDHFETHVRPLLIEHCYECHSAEHDEASGDLRLDTAQAMRRGGASGPAIVAGEPEASLMMKVVSYEDETMAMPPEGKLPSEAIEHLRRWIADGAYDPRQKLAPEQPSVSPLDIDPQSHWAFRTPVRSVPPSEIREPVANQSGPRDADPIDAFASKAARSVGLVPNEIADDRTLVRRLYFDLTGLPPTADEIEGYAANPDPSKFTRLVDRLISGPAFGERMARHWMDVARYADTIGYATAGKDRRYHGSERYRDWLIQAFATDMPYDDMVRHQLAGDRTDPDNAAGNLDAMGFLTLGRKFLNGFDTYDDRIDVVTRGLLGLTVACARCHDHKFDPIPTSDYYGLLGVFTSSEPRPDAASPMAMVDKPNPHDERIMKRGQPGNRGEVAKRQFLTALRRVDDQPFRDGSGRAELAERIVADDNPLASRVMVNRLWQTLIAKPLVNSSSDFGVRTEPPGVPEVLDNLSVAFATDDSVKRMVRRIVHTRIYRMTSRVDDSKFEIDPDNRFLGRANRRRRDFESMRDSMLKVTGHLDRRLSGPPIEITGDFPVPRRSVYGYIDRQNLPPVFRTFDFASPDAHSPGRHQTTVPQQGLYFLNSEQTLQLSRWLGEQAAGSSPDRSGQIRYLFRRILSREPTEPETELLTRFLNEPSDEFVPPLDAKSLWQYGLATVDAKTQRPIDFKPFAHFAGDRYTFEKDFPSGSAAGYAYLSAGDGHAPRQTDFAVVRRFIPPSDGRLSFRTQSGHRAQVGDGVIMTVFNGDQRVHRRIAKGDNVPYGPKEIDVRRGVPLDFVASAGESDNSDSFFWRMTLSLRGHDGNVLTTQSEKDFGGPESKAKPESLTRVQQAAQILLCSNEFLFVD